MSYQNISVPGLEQHPTASIAMTVHANYAANDYVGVSGVATVFPNCASRPGGGGYISAALLTTAVAGQSSALELWMFDTPVTPPTDSTAWTISTADLRHLVAVIPFSTYYLAAGNGASFAIPAGMARYTCQPTSRDLYGCVVNRAASPAWASGDLQFRLSVVQD
jgi:hypothetical protein